MSSYTMDGDYLGGYWSKKIKGITKKAAFVSALPVLGLSAIPATIAYKLIKKKRAAAAAAAAGKAQTSYTPQTMADVPVQMNQAMPSINFPQSPSIDMPESAPITTDPYAKPGDTVTTPKKSKLPTLLALAGIGAAFFYFKSKKGGAS